MPSQIVLDHDAILAAALAERDAFRKQVEDVKGADALKKADEDRVKSEEAEKRLSEAFAEIERLKQSLVEHNAKVVEAQNRESVFAELSKTFDAKAVLSCFDEIGLKATHSKDGILVGLGGDKSMKLDELAKAVGDLHQALSGKKAQYIAQDKGSETPSLNLDQMMGLVSGLNIKVGA